MFDRCIVVDWSAASSPKRGPDSIWACSTDDGTPVNLPTRLAAMSWIVDRLRSGGRTLIGFDFPFGYPYGFASRAGLTGATPWSATWRQLTEHVVDDERNRNNRWVVAAALNERLGQHWFWGVPASREAVHLRRWKSPAWDELRIAEQRLRHQGLRPFPTRHLFGAGSVGSQALTGIPCLHRLRHSPNLASRVRVWPFETGLIADPTSEMADAIVLAEVWPSSIPFDHIDHPVKDARQVVAAASTFASLDCADRLGRLFVPSLEPDEAAVVVAEEGWILGVE